VSVQIMTVQISTGNHHRQSNTPLGARHLRREEVSSDRQSLQNRQNCHISQILNVGREYGKEGGNGNGRNGRGEEEREGGNEKVAKGKRSGGKKKGGRGKGGQGRGGMRGKSSYWWSRKTADAENANLPNLKIWGLLCPPLFADQILSNFQLQHCVVAPTSGKETVERGVQLHTFPCPTKAC